MKKLVALFLTLALALGVTTALAAAQIPTTLDEAKVGFALPEVPNFTITQTDEDDGYGRNKIVIETDWMDDPDQQCTWVWLWELDDTQYFEWESGNRYTAWMTPEEFASVHAIEFELDNVADDTLKRIAVYTDSKEIISLSCYNGDYTGALPVGLRYGMFYGNEPEWLWISQNADGETDIRFTEGGDYLGSVSHVYGDTVDMEIAFNRYGQREFAFAYNTDDSFWWDGENWISEFDGEVYDLGVRPEGYTAPHTVDYVNTLPPATLAELGVNKADVVPVTMADPQLVDGKIVIPDDGYDWVSAYFDYTDANGGYHYIHVPMMLDAESKSWIEGSEEDIMAFALSIAEQRPDVPDDAVLNIDVIRNGVTSSYQDGKLVATNVKNVTLYADGTVQLNEGDTNLYNVSALYNAEGNMISYGYSDMEHTYYVTYNMAGELLHYWGKQEDGTYYAYDGEGWKRLDVNSSELVACEKPEGIEVPGPLTEDKIPEEPKAVWYPNNTVCVAGYSLRDLYPELTDKWYNVVPVDLTQDGVQTFRLVASNLFYIGQAAVIVDGDNVTVEYALIPGGHGYVKSEALTWFTAVGDITTEFLENPEGDVAFGQTISREKDLGGQDVALLFICNHVTYRQPYFNNGVNLVRYWPNHHAWVDYRESLQPLMEQVPMDHPEEEPAA